MVVSTNLTSSYWKNIWYCEPGLMLAPFIISIETKYFFYWNFDSIKANMRWDISPRWEEEISPILDKSWQKWRDWWQILQQNFLDSQNFLEEILATLCRQKCEENDRGVSLSEQQKWGSYCSRKESKHFFIGSCL